MSLPQAIRSMLNGVTGVNLAEITYGTRNEFESLPAVAYVIDENETMTIGTNPLQRCKVTIKSVAQTAEAAQALGEAVEAELDTGTYNSIVFEAIVNKNSVLQEGSTGLGEETNPFVCVTTAEIYYKG